jgi:hypothetical protein
MAFDIPTQVKGFTHVSVAFILEDDLMRAKSQVTS